MGKASNKRTEAIRKYKSWADLTFDEKEAWLNKYPDMRSSTSDTIAEAYDNVNYIEEFGYDDWLKEDDKRKRDAAYKSKILNDAFGEESDAVKNKIAMMTPEGQKELLESDFTTKAEADERNAEYDAEIKREKGSFWHSLASIAMDDSEGLDEKKNVAERAKESYNRYVFGEANPVTGERTGGKNDAILKRISAADDERKNESATEIADVIEGEYNKDRDKALSRFQLVFNGGEGEETGFGNTKYQYDGIGIYKQFEDSKYFDELTDDDKIRLLSKYDALRAVYGGNDALAAQVITTLLQNYISDKQTSGDWWRSVGRGIGAKTAASFGQFLCGLEALTLAMVDATVNDGKDRVGHFLQGQDEDGKELEPWHNIRYWNGMDQYSAFNFDEIKKIEENGNLSPYNYIPAAGGERGLNVALSEAGKMIGYTVAQATIARVLGGVGKGVSYAFNGFNPVFTEAGALMESASKMAVFNTKYLTPLVISSINAVPIATAYAKGSFDTILQELTGEINYAKEQDAAKAIGQIMDGVTFENGKFVGVPTEGDAKDDAENLTRALNAGKLNAYVDAKVTEEVQKYLKEHPEVKESELDTSAIREYYAQEAAQNFAEHNRQVWLEEHKDDYKDAEAKALQSARAAYEMNASIEWLRMCGANYFLRQYLFDKSTRMAMRGNNNNLTVADANGNLISRGTLLGMQLSPKAVRGVEAVKTVFGGGWTNYMDDITALGSKAWARQKYNLYNELGIDAEKAAAASLPFAAVMSGMFAGKQGLVDPQSGFDFIVGALGTAVGANLNLVGIGSRVLNNKMLNRYDAAAISREANKHGLSVEEYIRGDFSKVAKKENPRASAAEIRELAESKRRKEGIEAKIADGTIKKRSFAEQFSDFIINPVIQSYGDAIERERSWQAFIDVANKVGPEKAKAIQDILMGVINANIREHAIVNEKTIDAKDAKSRAAFYLVSLLEQWAKDPVLSKTEAVQKYIPLIEEYSKGNISDTAVQEFLSLADNRVIREGENPEGVARERIQRNAQELIEMRDAYRGAIEQVKNSPLYKTIQGLGEESTVVTQLAFYKSIIPQREQRAVQMHKETVGSEALGSLESDVAKYGSERGLDNAIEVKQEQVDALREQLAGAEEQLKDEKKAKRRNNPRRKYRISGLKAEIASLERELTEEGDEIARLKGRKNSIDFSRVLTKEEILALAPKDMAMILNPEGKSIYSKEQQKVIDEVMSDLKFKDPNALEKIRDIAELVERNKDARRAYDLMSSDLVAARDYYEYARAMRGYFVERFIVDNNIDAWGDIIDEAPTEAAKFEYAKQFPFTDALDRYKKRYKLAEGEEYPDFIQRAEKIIAAREDAESLLVNQFGEQGKQFARRLRRESGTDRVQSEADIIDIVEQFGEEQTDQRSKDSIQSVVASLQRLGYQRDATVTEARRKKQEQEKRNTEKAKSNDGSNFDWDGYKKGDTVYRKSDGKKGTVIGFFKRGDGQYMKVQFDGEKGLVELSSANKDNYSKTAIKRDSKEPSTPPTEAPEKPATPKTESSEGFEVKESTDVDLTQDGAPVVKSTERQAEEAAAEAGTFIVEPTEKSVGSESNKIPQSSGLLVGNALYVYDYNELTRLGIAGIRTDARAPLQAFLDWCKDNKIQIQKIVDRELHKIIKAQPDTKIQFMHVNLPNMEKHVLQVVEYTPAVQKIHNENLGGVIPVGDTRYLVVGSLSWYKNADSKGFYDIANPLRAEAGKAGGIYYVHPTMYTEVAKINSGYIVKQQEGEVKAEKRRLSTLFYNEDGSINTERNPNELNLEDAIFGIMYDEKRFVPLSNPGKARLFPPEKSITNIGRTFMMIPSANGDYIPIALERDVYINNLVDDSAYKKEVLGYIRLLYNDSLSVRQDAVKKLPLYFITSNEKGKETTILVGNTSYNTVTVKRDGATVFSGTVGPNFDSVGFMQAVLDTFRINLTPQSFNSYAKIKMLDEAGALLTDVSSLETVGASYSVFGVGKDGKPIKFAIEPIEPVERDAAPIVTTADIGKEKYRKRGNEYYDSENQIVRNTPENADLYQSIVYNIMIQEDGLIPVFVNKKGEQYFIISDNPDHPLMVKRGKDNWITVASTSQAKAMLTKIQKEVAEKARQDALKQEAERINEEEERRIREAAERGEGIDLLEGELPAQNEVIKSAATSIPERAEDRKPESSEPQESPAQSEEKNPNKATRKSLAELEAEIKKPTFENKMMKDDFAEKVLQIAEDKGWNLGNSVEEAHAFLEKRLPLGTLDSITNEDSFLDMLKNCY